MKACWPSPGTLLICAAGSGDRFGGGASPCWASTKLSCAFAVALPSAVAAANGSYASAAASSTRKFGRASTVKLHWLSVLLAISLVDVRPAPGTYWLSTEVLTLLHASGT